MGSLAPSREEVERTIEGRSRCSFVRGVELIVRAQQPGKVILKHWLSRHLRQRDRFVRLGEGHWCWLKRSSMAGPGNCPHISLGFQRQE